MAESGSNARRVSFHIEVETFNLKCQAARRKPRMGVRIMIRWLADCFFAEWMTTGHTHPAMQSMLRVKS